MSSKRVTFLISCIGLLLASGVSSLQHENNQREKVNSLNYTKKYSRIPSMASKFFYSSHDFDWNKIVGGYYAVDGQFPFMAVVHRLMPGGATSQCGGTIISERWVLTAGHCIHNFPRKFFVVFGIVDKEGIGYNYYHGSGVSMITSHAVAHPKYYHTANDVGLLRMPRDIPFTQKIQPIQLASSNETSESFVDMTGYAVGWGKDGQASSGTKALKYAMLAIIGNDECSRTWKIDKRNICTGSGLGQNSCQGDSGGPLLVMRNNVPLQVGIVSYGDGNCPSDRPGVFTRITNFSRWIGSVTGIRY